MTKLKPQPNEYNISYSIIQLWCCMKCCTRLATMLYRAVSCCIRLCEVWSRSNFFTKQILYDKTFLLFAGCFMMLYSFGYPMQLCCTLLQIFFQEMLYRVVRNVAFILPQLATICKKCCIMFYEMFYSFGRGLNFDPDQTFSINECCTIQHFFVFRDDVWCCARLAIPCNFIVLCCTRAGKYFWRNVV